MNRIVAYIPYGRKTTVEILIQYLQRDHEAGVIDEVMLCMNTEVHQVEDREYAYSLALEHDWINTYERPGSTGAGEMDVPEEWKEGPLKPKQLNTGRFFWYMQEGDTTYIRFDDDVVWIAPDAISNMVQAKLKYPESTAIFPIIWNNAICTWWLQNQEHWLVPLAPRVSRKAVDPIGWGSPKFAADLHRALLDFLESGDDPTLLNVDSFVMDEPQQFSVSCFAISGQEYKDLEGVIDYPEEEHWLTQHRPKETYRWNRLIGNAHVAHFSFFPQRDYLLRKTDILERYRTLAEAL